MKRNVVLMVAMLALSSAAFADPPGSGGTTGNGCVENCGNGGNGNGGGGSGGGGGTGGAGGTGTGVGIGVGVGVGIANATAAANAAANAAALANQSQTATASGGQGGNASAQGGSATAQGGNSTIGNVTATTNNTVAGGTASVGNVSATTNNTANGGVGGQGGQGGTGGTGGEAVASAVVENGAVVVNVDTNPTRAAAAPVTYKYVEVQQAPAIGQGSFAIQGCGVAGNGGASFPGGAGFLGFGFTPEQCYDFMLAQAYEALGEKKAACDILRNSKAGKRQEKRGITLPGCEPEVVTTVVPVPVPVDLSPYATKEELNRAFKASQSK